MLARVRPFILRRTKAQVAPELPERSEQTIHCELEGPQRKLYEQLRDALPSVAAGADLEERDQPIARSRSSRRCCGSGRRRVIRRSSTSARRADPSAKLDVARSAVDRGAWRRGTRRSCSHSSPAFSRCVRARLDADGIIYEYLDGQTRDRAIPVARFQERSSVPGCS